MQDSQGSRLDFWNGQGVKLKNLMGQDLDSGRGWKYRCPEGFSPPHFLSNNLCTILYGSVKVG